MIERVSLKKTLQSGAFSGDDKNLLVPEFTCTAHDQWAYEHGVELRLIQHGMPTQNGFIESCNGRFRDECLNEHWFSHVSHARKRTVNAVSIITSTAFQAELLR